MTQQRFETLGNTLLKIADKIVKNTELCKMLKYSDIRSGANCPNFNSIELLNENIVLKPLLPKDDAKESYLVILLTNFQEDPGNPDFKILSIRFDIFVPYADWDKMDGNLKPFAIMSEVDKMFNGARLNGIGTLKFADADLVTLGDNMGGYSVVYTVNDFN